ncbi:MAG: L-lactate permease [Gemmataceae bacterium]|nr:L-lactate permease [Gemmataceae bacterium]
MLPWSGLWSTVLAFLPVAVLFWLLVVKRWAAPLAGAGATVCAGVIAIGIYGTPIGVTCMAFVHGAAFGFLPIGWTVFCAMLLYNMTVQSGKFEILRQSVAGLSDDARLQAILIGFSFGAFLEGAAGAGTPVAICAAILVGLGFKPIQAAILCLLANTSPVAYGGLGTPLITLTGVTGIPTETLSTMAGHQLPLLSLVIPAYMVGCMCPWRKVLEVWPALLVSGGSFAGFQYLFATMHDHVPGLVLYPMTDIGGGIFSLVATAVFLKVWHPRVLLYPDGTSRPADSQPKKGPAAGAIFMAWLPYLLMSFFLLLAGLVKQREVKEPVVFAPGLQSTYPIAIPFLDKEIIRDAKLHDPSLGEQKPEGAVFHCSWLTAGGTSVLLAALVSIPFLGMRVGDCALVLKQTLRQMAIPIPTIMFMLGFSYLTRYAGMDATLGVAFAQTGIFYPFFAAILGWLGVFLTGTDAGSNALFGSLQKITASQIYSDGAITQLSLDQAQVLICTANSTGGVMGKMIDAQSIVVATSATGLVGREADIFKGVVWHSIFLAAVVGLLTVIQAYVPPFNLLVPGYTP